VGPKTATELRPGVPCVFLLPVLELPLDEVQKSLEAGLRAHGLSGAHLSTFPFVDVTTLGLQSHSENWINLGLIWAESLPASRPLTEALQTLTSDGPTQKTRHAAQRALAKKHAEFST